MTQAEARNAVRHLRCKLSRILTAKPDDDTLEAELTGIYEDLMTIEQQLTRKISTPNCRPATREELEQLCKGGNVVMFPAAA